MRRPRSLFRWVVRVGVSLALATYILANEVSPADLRATLAGADVTLLAAAAALYLAGQALSALKWMVLGRSVGFARSAGSYTRFYLIGMFFNLFGPSTLGGDLVRGLYLADGRRPTLALSSVLFDRMSGLAVLMGMGSLALLASPRFQFPWPLTALVVAGGIGLVVGWWVLPALVGFLPTHHRLRRRIEHDLAPFWRDRSLLFGIVLLSACFHLSQVALQYLLARAAGARVPFGYCLVFHPLLAVLTALPISVSGLGIREGGYLFFLSRIGVADPVAVAVGLAWWVITLVSGLVGGLVFLASGARLPRLRFRNEDAPAAPADARYGAYPEVHDAVTPDLPPA